MHRSYQNSYYPYYENSYPNDQRFIGPILPFIGGAVVGYFAGRPQYNYTYPAYYPVYYYPNYPITYAQNNYPTGYTNVNN